MFGRMMGAVANPLNVDLYDHAPARPPRLLHRTTQCSSDIKTTSPFIRFPLAIITN